MRQALLILPLMVGYVRVSTDEQHLSVENQRADIRRWWQPHQMPLVAIDEDVGINGRPSLEKQPSPLPALAVLTRGYALLVVRRERRAWDIYTAAMAERIAAKAGGSMLTVAGAGDGETPGAVLMRTMIGPFAAAVPMRCSGLMRWCKRIAN